MPNPAPIVSQVCEAYHLLVQLAPYVAMLIVAGALFLGIFTKHVPIAAVLFAIAIAMLIASFSAVLGALGVQIPC